MTLRITSRLKPRPCKNRMCRARSLASTGGVLNLRCQIERAAATSLSLRFSRAAPIAASEIPLPRNSCVMRWAPKRRRRDASTCSTTRASDSHPRRSKSSSSAGISSGFSVNGVSLAASSSREYSRRASAASARERRLRGGLLFRGCGFGELGSATDAYLRANLGFDLFRHLRVFFEIVARVVLALADAFLAVRVPRARFVDDLVQHAELDDF